MINIKEKLDKYYKKDENIILACSAGPDSMFLLYEILKTDYKKNLIVCYFNHKTRSETEDEEIFLKKLCKKENIKFEVASSDFEKIQKLYPSKSFEELAREKRYQFFEAICNIHKSNKIITAHHLDDKIETFYFNLNRGSKLTGLINMKEFYGGILRPLLDIEKKEILEYLDKNKLKYFIDSSNLENKYSRNYLRNEIIPRFSKINSKFKKNISKTISYFEDLKNYIDEEVKGFLGENNNFVILEFNKKSIFLQKEIIRYIYYISNNKSTIGLSESNINEIIRFINGKNNKTIKEIKNMKLKKDNKIIKF